MEGRPTTLHLSGCIRTTVRRLVELRKGTVDTDGTILSNQVPKEPGKSQKGITIRRSINNMGGLRGREKKITWPMLMNIWLSLMFVALLSKRDRNRVAGRTWGSGGNCVTTFKTVFAIEVISYIDIGITTGHNFIEHGQDVIILFQSCRIGCGSYEEEMILNDWLG